jgi:hypothetical protein
VSRVLSLRLLLSSDMHVSSSSYGMLFPLSRVSCLCVSICLLLGKFGAWVEAGLRPWGRGDLFVFNDTIEGPRASAVKPCRFFRQCCPVLRQWSPPVFSWALPLSFPGLCLSLVLCSASEQVDACHKAATVSARWAFQCQKRSITVSKEICALPQSAPAL